ncbi:MAG TPA: DUF932 domain-containing protein [Polyangiaceae bacterium]|nr:DUF932 domain-containing protein [Polyangiaceae bacterium]
MNDRVSSALGLPEPLRPAPDMPASWQDVDLDFDTAAERFVQRHQADGVARDFPVMDLRLWGVAPDGERFALKPLAGHEPARSLRSTAFSMLCTRLGAPAEFIRDKLPAPLQLATLNYLMARGDERSGTAMLRLRGDEVTAIVSERYAPLDAIELVSTLRAALVRHGLLDSVRVKAVATGITDVIRLVLPSDAVPVKVGDVSLIGLDVSSSSFGRSAVHVRGVVWRLICMNGARTPSSMGDVSLRHLGETQRLRDGLVEGVATALAHARGLMDRWKLAVSTYITDLASYIDGLRELGQSEQQAIRLELGAKKPAELPASSSVYDVVNAITAAAHTAEPARRIELESIAGGVLLNQTGGRA